MSVVDFICIRAESKEPKCANQIPIVLDAHV